MLSGDISQYGKSRTFLSVEHFDGLVDTYIQTVVNNGEPLTYSGTLLFMGFYSRQNAIDFGNNNKQYKPCLTRIKFICEQFLELGVTKNDCNTAGLQFLLKSLHGHKERQLVEVMPVSINIDGVDAKL